MKVEVDVPNKPTVSVDVKQHFNNNKISLRLAEDPLVVFLSPNRICTVSSIPCTKGNLCGTNGLMTIQLLVLLSLQTFRTMKDNVTYMFETCLASLET